MSSVKTTRSKKFNKPDADVTLKSSDGVLFALHKKNLASLTGGFPSVDMNSENETVELSEAADVLELLFQFVYPPDIPNFENISFKLFEQLAQAAERMHMINLVQRYTFKSSSTRQEKENMTSIFKFAVRRSYMELVDEAAPLMIDHTPHSIMLLFPVERQAYWIIYREQWISAHRRAYAELLSIIATKKKQEACACWSSYSKAPPVLDLDDIVSLDKFISRVVIHCRYLLAEWKTTVEKEVKKIQTFSSVCEKSL